MAKMYDIVGYTYSIYLAQNACKYMIGTILS